MLHKIEGNGETLLSAAEGINELRQTHLTGNTNPWSLHFSLRLKFQCVLCKVTSTGV